MRLRNSALCCGLLVLALTVLPVKSSDFTDPTNSRAQVMVDISKNIATLEGWVASPRQAEQAETLVFQLTQVDWIENKLKVNAEITTTHLSAEFISLVSATSAEKKTASISG